LQKKTLFSNGKNARILNARKPEIPCAANSSASVQKKNASKNSPSANNKGIAEIRCLKALLKRRTLFLFMFQSKEPFVFWLTRISYSGERKAVLAEFSNGNIKRTLRFAFLPGALLSKKKLSKEEIKQCISAVKPGKYRISEKENCWKITAANFEILEKITNLIFEEHCATAVMPSPEKQFLIEKNWNFFEAFEFNEDAVQKTECTELPDVKMNFFSETLPKTIKELEKIDSEETNKIISLIAFSKALKMPLEELPSSGFAKQEIFLENAMFKENFAIEKIAKKEKMENHETQAASFFRGTPEMDILPLVPFLLTNDFYNTSFETLNCECCEPKNSYSKNLLQNSMAEAEFSKDGFYFDSLNPEYAKFYHATQPLKENRERRKKEFFLKNFPVGPFSRNQRQFVLLGDALELQKNKTAEILGIKKKIWHCEKKQGFVSIITKTLDSEIREIEKKIKHLQNNTIGGRLEIQKNYGLELEREHKKALEFFLHNLPAQLADNRSRFYSLFLGETIKAVHFSAPKAWETLKEKSQASSEIQKKLVALAKN